MTLTLNEDKLKRTYRLNELELWNSDLNKLPSDVRNKVRDAAFYSALSDADNVYDYVDAIEEQLQKGSRYEDIIRATAKGLANVGSAFQQARAKLAYLGEEEFDITKPHLGMQTKAQAERQKEKAGELRSSAELLWEVAKQPELAMTNDDIFAKATDLIGQTLPYIASTVTAGIVAGPAGAFAVGSLVEGNTAYRTALDEGVDPDLALAIGVGVGIISGSIESAGFKGVEKLFERAAKKYKNDIIRRGIIGFASATVIEALEEGSQEIAQLTGEAIYRDINWNEAVTRTLGSMAGGAFLGGAMKGGGVAFRRAMMMAAEPTVGEVTLEKPIEAEEPMEAIPEGKAEGFVHPLYGFGGQKKSAGKLVVHPETKQIYEDGEPTPYIMGEDGIPRYRTHKESQQEGWVESRYTRTGQVKTKVRQKEAAKPAPAKQPWEMTREEWDKNVEFAGQVSKSEQIENYKKILFEERAKLKRLRSSQKQFEQRQAIQQTQERINKLEEDIKSHEIAVHEAVLQGKPVPREVLEEYKGEVWADEALAKQPAPKEAKPEITPERKVSRLAERTQELAIEKELTESLGELPTYETMKMAEQAKMIVDIINTDWERAKRIARGEEKGPEGLREEGMYRAVSLEATKRGDVETLRDLAVVHPRVSLELTAKGQAVKAADYGRREISDPVRAMQDIQKAREARVKKKHKVKNVKSETKRMAKEAKTEMRKKLTHRQSWNQFVESIRC